MSFMSVAAFGKVKGTLSELCIYFVPLATFVSQTYPRLTLTELQSAKNVLGGDAMVRILSPPPPPLFRLTKLGVICTIMATVIMHKLMSVCGVHEKNPCSQNTHMAIRKEKRNNFNKSTQFTNCMHNHNDIYTGRF